MSKNVFKIEGLLEINGNDVAFKATKVDRLKSEPIEQPNKKRDEVLRRARDRMEQKSRRLVFSTIANAGRKMHVDEIAKLTHLNRRTIECCISDIRTTGHDVPAERSGRGAFYRYNGKKVA
jgi:acyl-CoA reductase-like NAD-dependent aldehyde dehydrogenase